MTEHSLTALRRAAVAHVTCRRCGHAPTERCTADAEAARVVTPHDERIEDAALWFAGYDFAVREGGLRTQLTNALHDLEVAVDQVGTLTDDVRDAVRRVNVAEDQAAIVAKDLNTAMTRNRLLEATHLLDLKTIAELRAQLEPTPEPPTQRMFFGACPDKTGSSNKGLADAKRVTGKWGKGAAVRQYFGGIGDVAPRDPDAGIVHASWKEFNKANLTPAKIKAAIANLRAGDAVEVGHESDNDGLTGDALQARIDIKNLFHDTVKQVRPDLLVCHTFTGWLFEPKSGKLAEAEMWLSKVRADIIGLDCDGIRPTKLPYTDYKGEFAAALPMLEKYAHMGYRWIAFPEFGCPRIPAADPDGQVRAAYHDSYAKLWSASGKALYACLYEYNSSENYSLTTPAEISGWKAWV